MKLGTILAAVSAGVLGLSVVGLSPMFASAEYTHHYDMPEITGTITASENHSENLQKVQVSFSEASQTAQAAVEDGKVTGGRIGVVNGYLVYQFKVVDGLEKSHKVIVDAGENSILYVSEGKSWDDLKRHGYGHKWMHHEEMMKKFSQMSPEEMTQKFTQFKEMKQAFDAISDEDKQTIKSHFKEMKGQFHELSEEERDSMKSEYKQKMQAFSEMTLDEKISHLEELAASIRAQS